MKNPKVSVVIPIYGVESYIERCAKSLFEQTLEDIEFIFVDDCSPDKSVEILTHTLERYPLRQDQVRIVRMPKNGGLPKARRYGLQFVRGEYIIHCDSDDWVDNDMYESLYYEALRGNHDMVICDYYISKAVDDNIHVTQEININPRQLMHDILSEHVHSAVWNKLVKSSIYNNHIIYPEYNLREDLALMCQLLYYSKSIGYINKPCYHYFNNIDSITKRMLSKEQEIQRSMQAIYNCELMDNFFSNKSDGGEYKSDMINMKLRLKNSVADLTSSQVSKKKWMQIFPECSIWEYLKSTTPIRGKLIYILAYFGVYHIIKPLFKH